MILLIHEDGSLQQINRDLTSDDLKAIDDGILTAVEMGEDGRFREYDGAGDSTELPLVD